MSPLDLAKITELIATGIFSLIVNLVVPVTTGSLTFLITKFKLEQKKKQWEKEVKLKERELYIQTQELRLKERELDEMTAHNKMQLNADFTLRKQELMLKAKELELREFELKLGKK